MSGHQQSTASSNVPTSSVVQIAFDSDVEPDHCGYCNTNGSCTVGVVASNMLVDDYQLLMDRGWRKCGTYYYKALMNKTCCPLYTIRCDTNHFQISRSQRRVIQNMNLFINENIKPDPNSNSIPSKKDKIPISLNEWIKTEPSTRAIELIRHVLTTDTPPSDEFLSQLRSRQKRWYKKLLKLKSQNKLTPHTNINLLIKRFNRIKIESLEQLLKFNENPKNKFQCRLICSYPPSDEFKRTLIESHSIYERYQMAIHGDSKSKCSLSQFEEFLCESSLYKESSTKIPSCGYGSFHLQYYLNDKMIACSVIDILPGGLSSVYFYYEPDFSFLKLGVYSALKEIELTRQLANQVPDLKYYYLGFYVHSCVKMRYKGQYEPSFLLCPETYTWHSIEKCVPLLNNHKYIRFESDPNKVDEDEETNIEKLKLRLNNQIITPSILEEFYEDFFFNILDCFVIFAKSVGRIFFFPQMDAAALLLLKQLRELNRHPVEGISAGLIDESNPYAWNVILVGPNDTLYEGGFFKARLDFPKEYPIKPPKMKFLSEIWHPNIEKNGDVCISILHEPGVDQFGYEKASERWSPVQSVETILLSVLSMLSDPNCDSAANIDASVMWRDDRSAFKKKVSECVRKTHEDM